jgi:hypothetical protein
MKITKQQLIELNACERGLERFIEQTDDTDKPVEIVSLIGGENTIGDLTWLAGKICDKKDIIKFVCKCALINIELIKPYTDKYDLIVGFLNNPFDDTRFDVRTAYATRTAAFSVRNVDSTSYTVRNAAFSAFYAADFSVRNSVDNAVVYAIHSNLKSKPIVDQYLKELFTK